MTAELKKDLDDILFFVTQKFVFVDVKECAVTVLKRKKKGKQFQKNVVNRNFIFAKLQRDETINVLTNLILF